MVLTLFENATKKKVRFSTSKGSVGVEDLWDLPLTSAGGASLDGVAKTLSRKIKDGDEESFVDTAKSDPAIALAKFKLDIVKRIIAVRIEESEKVRKAGERKAKKDQIMDVLAKRQDESLEQSSEADLRKMLDDLDK